MLQEFFATWLNSEIIIQLGNGFLMTLSIFFQTLLYALPLGLVVALAEIRGNCVTRVLLGMYISIMRGTPLMLQLLVCFFGPYYIFGLTVDDDYRFTAVIIAFVLNYAAYFAEIFRSGIQSISQGQREAAMLLGYSNFQTFIFIILPQVIKRVLPPLTNEAVTLVKDTSLAFTISVLEMFTLAKQLSGAKTSMVPLILAGIIYYLFCLIVAFLMEKLEKSMNYYR